jgi:hypothetical protein
MTFDQAALTDMFRQGFAGLNTLGGGQLALAQAQQERGYAERQEAMRREMQRQAQLEMLGVQNSYATTAAATQNQFATDRQRQQNEFATTAAAKAAEDALALQRQRGIDATTTAKATARVQARGARNTAKEVRGIEYSLKLRERAADAGIDPALDDAALEKALAGKQQERQDTADAYQATLTGLQAKAEALAGRMQVPEAKRLAVAKQILIGDAEGDADKIAAINKLTSTDEAESLFSEITGPQYDNRIAALEKPLVAKYGAQARSLGIQIQTAQRGLDTLARRDIIPRLNRDATVPVDFGIDEGAAGAGMGLPVPGDDFMPKRPPATESTSWLSSNWLTPALNPTAGLAALAVRPALNAAGRGIADYIVPPAAESARYQQDYVNAIKGLIDRSGSFGSDLGGQPWTPDRERQMRAMTYAPQPDYGAIQSIMGINPNLVPAGTFRR